MSFTLPDLPYSFDALEPHIDARTMEIHHDKHHAGYTTKLNAALVGHDDLADKSIEELLFNVDSLPEGIRNTVRNNGGGFANHSLFWSILSPTPSLPDEALVKAIDAHFGSLDAFKEQFTQAASNQFGSGWAWLTVENGELHVCSTPNQDTPLMKGNTPILGLDVWEHAYYLAYQNRRPDYIAAWWNIVNWKEVSALYQKAQG